MVDIDTLQPKFLPHEYATPSITAASVTDDILHVSFADGHDSEFVLKDLHDEFSQETKLLQMSEYGMPSLMIWDSNLGTLPTHQYDLLTEGETKANTPFFWSSSQISDHLSKLAGCHHHMATR